MEDISLAIGSLNIFAATKGKSYFAQCLIAEAILKGGGAILLDTKGDRSISQSKEFKTRRFNKKKPQHTFH